MKKIITLLALVACVFFSKAQIITTVAGKSSCCFADSVPATLSTCNATGVVFDASGNLYIPDGDRRLRKVNTAGIITTIAGNGTGGYSGDGGQATAAGINGSTIGIVIDTHGNVYISDPTHSVVRMINTSGIITTIAGNGSGSFSGDGGQATAASLQRPQGLALDGSGNLYIADTDNGRIRKVYTNGIIATVAGGGTSGLGDGGPPTAAILGSPYGVIFDAANNMYISEGVGRVRMVNIYNIINTIAGNGISAYSGDGGQATAASLQFAQGIALDGSGNLYIADYYSYNVRQVNTSGIINTIAGNGVYGHTGDGGAATAAELMYPQGITFDGAGNLYIADGTFVRKVGGIGSSTGIEKVNIYPNPNNGNFVIEVNNNTKQAIQIYDITGRLVLSQKPTANSAKEGNSITVDASGLPAGIYNASVTSSMGVVNKRLVIVR